MNLALFVDITSYTIMVLASMTIKTATLAVLSQYITICFTIQYEIVT